VVVLVRVLGCLYTQLRLTCGSLLLVRQCCGSTCTSIGMPLYTVVAYVWQVTIGASMMWWYEYWDAFIHSCDLRVAAYYRRVMALQDNKPHSIGHKEVGAVSFHHICGSLCRSCGQGRVCSADLDPWELCLHERFQSAIISVCNVGVTHAGTLVSKQLQHLNKRRRYRNRRCYCTVLGLFKRNAQIGFTEKTLKDGLRC
jgi:hypothetical protein